jgi:nicotinamidase/pyrazinamidase
MSAPFGPSVLPNMQFRMNELVRGKMLVYPGGRVPAEFVASGDVDPQRGFTEECPAELPVEGGHEIAGELNAQAQFAAYRWVSVEQHPTNAYWVASMYHPQLSPVVGIPGLDVYWNLHCASGTPGSWLLKGLPHMREYHFWAVKGTQPDMHPYGPCYQDQEETISTGLIEWNMARGVRVMILGGLAFDFCVRLAAKQLVAAGFTVILNLAATRAVDPASTEKVLKELTDLGSS